VAVTGNARLDDLAAQFNTLQPIRGSIRQELGADRPLAVLAAKFSEIQHVLGDLTEAVAGLPEMRLIIKRIPPKRPTSTRRRPAASPTLRLRRRARTWRACWWPLMRS
jgi:hypothetical protein